MPEVYIVDAIRTPIGKKNGGLAPVHPIDLGAHIIKALVERTGIDPSNVDDVVFGCVDAIGGQAGNIARLYGWPRACRSTCPCDGRPQCGSSQQAIQFGAQAILAGTADLIIAGGVQNMSQIPISAAMIVGEQYGFSTPTAESKGWAERYGDEEVSQFRGAEMIADKWDISREELEKWALQSHERAKAAIAEGRFENEIVPFGDVTTDEGPRETAVLLERVVHPDRRHVGQAWCGRTGIRSRGCRYERGQGGERDRHDHGRSGHSEHTTHGEGDRGHVSRRRSGHPSWGISASSATTVAAATSRA
ncbi:hypothetical protein GS887_26850 [Rhodococcus hoagii]|nr:hypothetical protein [Prescottella equi]